MPRIHGEDEPRAGDEAEPCAGDEDEPCAGDEAEPRAGDEAAAAPAPSSATASTRRRYLRTLGAAAVGSAASATATADDHDVAVHDAGPYETESYDAAPYEAEVYSEDETWHAVAHDATVYTGDDVFAAIRAAVDGLTTGRTEIETVVVRDDATASLDGIGVDLPSYTALAVRGTIELTDGGGVPIYADGVESIAVPEFSLVGPASMGMRIRRSTDVHLGAIDLEMSGGGIGIRVDDGHNDGTPVRTTDVTLERAEVAGTDDHAVETYGVDGLAVGLVHATDTAGCGLLLNDTSDAAIGTVVGHRAPASGGYATFRTANDAGPEVHVEHVTSVDSGRGLFNVSSSGGVTVDSVHVVNAPILLQNAQDYEIAGGLVKDVGGDAIRVDSRNDGSHDPTADVTVRNVRFADHADAGTVHAIRATGPDTGPNRFVDNDVRDGPSDEPIVSYDAATVVEGTVTGSADLPDAGTFRLEAVDDGRALTVLDDYDADGAPLGGREWANWSTQHWELEPLGDGVYRVASVHSGKALDVDARAVEPGAAVQQWAWNDGGNQRWHVVDRGDGEYSLEAEHSGQALGVGEAADADGTRVVQSPWTDSDEQRWRLVPVSSEPEAPPDDVTDPCEDAAGGSLEVEGRTVCDLDGDGSYRDVTGDGDLGQDDVVDFFGVQHRDAWKQDAFDFSGNGEVDQFDVVELFDDVLTS